MTDQVPLKFDMTPCDIPGCPYPKVRIIAADTGNVLVDYCVTVLSLSPILAAVIHERAADAILRATPPPILADFKERRNAVALFHELNTMEAN